jgi:malate synthase
VFTEVVTPAQEEKSTIAAAESLRGFELNTAPAKPESLPAGFAEFFEPLHKRFTPWQQELVAKRRMVLSQAHEGNLPSYLPAADGVTSEWLIELPDWVQDQRNQMTGPADDAELVVKMLNSGAPGVMLDLEDSLANFWPHLETGIANILSALRGELSYFDKKRDKQIAIKDSKTVIFTRARGLHISQMGGWGKDELTSASLYDVARICFAINEEFKSKLKHPLSFYIPKSESAEEALWWNELFNEISRVKGWPQEWIKCMALVEAHPLAFQIEEFLYNLRTHIVGLNLGRWDYMASLIHFNFADPEWVLPDRNTIPHDVKFFQNLRNLIPSVCHRRGALAIGGMTALYPSREDAELNARALDVLAKDKKNEADCGMDGAWTGHPDQNQIAVDQFPVPNQLGMPTGKPDLNDARYPDLRPKPTGVGRRTLAGTRAAIRTIIRYRNGVLNGKGASLLDGYMEDLATDRIYRLMVGQRMKHRDQVQIADEKGDPVPHTPELISTLFDEELAKLVTAAPPDQVPTFEKARQIAEAMIVNNEIDPI